MARQRVDYLIPWLPHFYIAHGDQLKQSVRTALALCEVENSGEYMVVRDEVAYAKSWQVVSGLLEGQPDVPATVGGIYPDKALIPWNPDAEQEELKKEDLASVCVSTAVKRPGNLLLSMFYIFWGIFWVLLLFCGFSYVFFLCFSYYVI